MDPAVGLLLPRFRRPLSVGALLDDSIQVFRQHWKSLAVASAIVLLPQSAILVALDTFGLMRSSNMFALDPTPAPVSNAELIALFGLFVVTSFASLLWSAALVAASDAYFRGQVPTLSTIYGRAYRRFLPLLGSTLLLLVVGTVLTLISTALFVVTLFGAVGGLAAIIGLIYWWRAPHGRTRILKWMIILTAPYGLLIYYLTRWSLIVPAAVLERCGPLDAIKRSSRLATGEWFRIGAVLSVTSAVVSALVITPLLLLLIAYDLLGLAGSPFAPNAARSFVTNVVTTLVSVPIGSIGIVGYTLLFIDLRNRREGTDLFERITALEASARTPEPAAG
jgi:hypothetical protein